MSGQGLTAIDLFAGAGGASLGLVNAGYQLLLAADANTSHAWTHEHNLPGQFLLGDLRSAETEKIQALAGIAPGELDVLFAGPPCQGFSMLGRRVVWDERNNLFREVLRVATALKPRCVVIENVPGLLTLAGGAFLRDIIAGLAACGYEASAAELLAAQYGAPQMRWRVVIVAWRNDLVRKGLRSGYGFPKPTHGSLNIGDLVANVTISETESRGFLTTREAIGDLPPVSSGEEVQTYTGIAQTSYQKAMRQGLQSDLHNHYAPRLSAQTLRRIEMLKPGQDWRDLPVDLLPESMQRAQRKDHTRRYRRMTWDGVPRAIVTRFRDPKTGEYTHPEQDRTLTIREAARIQGFPDRFVFLGDRSAQYEQIGNAVPVALAEAIATEVAKCLNDEPGSILLNPFRRRPISALGKHGQLVPTLPGMPV